MNTINIYKDVPVFGKYDVVVCGGGPAGFIAAITAARAGASTAIIERYGFFGGMATAGLVTPISVFSYNGERVIGGIPWEFIERLEKMGGALVEQPLNNIAFDPELYKLCAVRMLIEAGVDIFTNSYLGGCKKENGKIRYAVFENKNGTEALEGRVFIDATGDGDLAYMAGVPMQPMNGDALQPATMYFVLSGVNTDSELIKTAMHHNRQGINCHCLPIREKLIEKAVELNIPDFGGPWFCTMLHEGSIAVNMTRTAANACDNRNFSRAEFKLREDVFSMTKILRENFEEFKNCYVSFLAPQAGVRETRRIFGVYTITGAEYQSAFRYEDSVSRGAHPIDIHSAKGASQVADFLKTAAYVPYRALIAEKFPNLLVAGRCLSADRYAFAALRVQASCMGMGQAAGVSAAMCAAGNINVENIDIATLQARLRDLGAVI